MSKDKKSELSRRGFLGIVGAVGAAAAIPLSWSRKAKPSEPVDFTEYVEPGSLSIESSSDDETWTNYDGYSGTIDGYWQGSPQIEIDGTKFDLYNYQMNFNANITEDQLFDGSSPFAVKGLNELEVECSFIGKQYLVETMKWDTKLRHVVIDTGKDKFEFDAYPKSIEHAYSPYGFAASSGFLSSVTFGATGEVTRIQGD